jgi:hypothetical protein
VARATLALSEATLKLAQPTSAALFSVMRGANADLKLSRSYSLPATPFRMKRSTSPGSALSV